MKTKSILITLILSAILLNTNSLADSYQGEFCHFAGIIPNSDMALEYQFKMLLEHEYSPNFQEISKAVAAVAIAPLRDLHNVECPIYNYSRALIEYYEQNKQQIVEDKPYIAEILEIIKKKISVKKQLLK